MSDGDVLDLIEEAVIAIEAETGEEFIFEAAKPEAKAALLRLQIKARDILGLTDEDLGVSETRPSMLIHPLA